MSEAAGSSQQEALPGAMAQALGMPPPGVGHTWAEDVQALLTGSALIALGLSIFSTARVFPGGIAGLSLLLQHWTGWRFGVLFFVLNLPFYGLALRQFGWRFTARTLVAVSLLALLSEMTPRFVHIGHIDRVYAAAMGGVLFGIGLLILFRHRGSLGGLGVLALFLQTRFGWRAGVVQMGLDAAIVGASFRVVGLEAVACSVLAAVALNLVIASNHRPGRYLGV